VTHRTLKQIMGGYLAEDTYRPHQALNELSVYTPSVSSGCPVNVSEGKWDVVSDPTRFKKEFAFVSAQMLIDFINELLAYQENAHHHGKITINHDSVIVEVYTQGVNTITELDQEYTHEVDNIYIDSEYANSGNGEF
jgi:pterin-4a-carbinolamine dehydratase